MAIWMAFSSDFGQDVSETGSSEVCFSEGPGDGGRSSTLHLYETWRFLSVSPASSAGRAGGRLYRADRELERG